MQNATTFFDLYQTELAKLREDAAWFAREQPAAAHALGMGHGRSGDPHVELLLQSFAYLTGRLSHQVEQDRALLPNAMLDHLCPHLTAPIPSLLVGQLAVNADSTGVLAQGREFYAIAQNPHGHKVRCRMATCFDVPLAPLTVHNLEHVAVTAYDELSADTGTGIHSVLKLRLHNLGTEPLYNKPVDKLLCYLDIEHLQVWKLYDLLTTQVAGLAVDAGKGTLRRGGEIRWLGFSEQEAALKTSLATHPGLRLIQEYFAFPEKFLFFEISGLDWRDCESEMDLLLLLRSGVDKSMVLAPTTLRLNCAPLINLFPQRLDPVALDQTRHEYRLSGDYSQHDYTEIYAIDHLEAAAPGQPTRPLAPYFGFEDVAQDSPSYFYTTRRVHSQFRGVPGTDVHVSFVDMHLQPQNPANDVIGGRAWCTNRRLVEQLHVGNRLRLDGPGPVRHLTVVSKPTAHQTPVLLAGQPWALVSQLSLNHLSLSSGPQALAALKQLLRAHLGPGHRVGGKQIDALRSLDVSTTLTPWVLSGRHSLVECLSIVLRVDASVFTGGSPLMLGEVLRYFLAHYASINTLVELALETSDVKGKVKTWPPMAGAQIVL